MDDNIYEFCYTNETRFISSGKFDVSFFCPFVGPESWKK